MPHKDPAARREYQRAYQQAYYAKKKAAVRAKHKAHYERAKKQVIAKQMTYYWRNRERILARRKAHYEQNRERASEYQRQRRKGDHAKRIQAERRRRGLPEALRPCPAVCECCGRPPKKLALSLDHCHRTGKFRGWLCTACNPAIGALGDNVEGLLRAVRYLRRAERSS